MSTDNLESIKQQYIDAALLHSKASADGDYKIANKQAGVLKRIYQRIDNETIDKSILIELLGNENISVRGWAAAHLLGLKYETNKAEETLQNIAVMKGKDVSENLEIFSAQMVLKVWKEHGYMEF